MKSFLVVMRAGTASAFDGMRKGNPAGTVGNSFQDTVGDGGKGEHDVAAGDFFDAVHPAHVDITILQSPPLLLLFFASIEPAADIHLPFGYVDHRCTDNAFWGSPIPA